jgi:hypothetical protein
MKLVYEEIAKINLATACCEIALGAYSDDFQ